MKTLKDLLGDERVDEYINLDWSIKGALYLSEKSRRHYLEKLYHAYGPHANSDLEVKRGYTEKGNIYVTIKKDGVEENYFVRKIPDQLLESPYIKNPFDFDNLARMNVFLNS